MQNKYNIFVLATYNFISVCVSVTYSGN